MSSLFFEYVNFIIYENNFKIKLKTKISNVNVKYTNSSG